MSTMIRDLWPSDIQLSEVISPSAVLKFQADSLQKRTQGLLTAQVVRTTADDRVVLRFEVEAPAVGKRANLFIVQHRPDLDYPVLIQPPEPLPKFLEKEVYYPGFPTAVSAIGAMARGRWEDNPWLADSPEKFVELVEKILNSPEVKSIILSLVAQSRQDQHTSGTATETT